VPVKRKKKTDASPSKTGNDDTFSGTQRSAAP